MRKVNLADVTEHERKSPKGKYHARLKEISLALGRGLHLPAGATLCPYHAHSAQSGLYLVIFRHGQVRHEGGITGVGRGDAFLFAPVRRTRSPMPDRTSSVTV